MFIIDFFAKIFNKAKRIEESSFSIDIPEDYDVLNEKIENGEIVLENLSDKELNIIKQICLNQLKKEEIECREILDQLKLKNENL